MTETNATTYETLPKWMTTERPRSPLDKETRIRLAKEVFDAMGIHDDPTITTEEAIQQVQEATRSLHEKDPNGASRELIAMRDE